MKPEEANGSPAVGALWEGSSMFDNAVWCRQAAENGDLVVRGRWKKVVSDVGRAYLVESIATAPGGGCSYHSSSLKNGPTITSNPHSYAGNAIVNASAGLEMVVLDGKVVAAIDNLDNPSTSLCPVMFNNDVLINGVNDVVSSDVSGLGVVVTGVDVRQDNVTVRVDFGGISDVVAAIDILTIVHGVIVSGTQVVTNVVGVYPSTSLLHVANSSINFEGVSAVSNHEAFRTNFIDSPTASPISNSGGFSSYLEPVVVEPGLNSPDIEFPACIELNGNELFVDVLIALISFDDLKLQLAYNFIQTCEDQTDCLDGHLSSHCGDGLDGQMMPFKRCCFSWLLWVFLLDFASCRAKFEKKETVPLFQFYKDGVLLEAFATRDKERIIALVGPKSSFPDLHASTFRGLPSLWVSDQEIYELAAPFQLSLVDPSHILIKLSNDLDYCRVFCHRSYLVFNCFMKLTKWSPILDIGVESPVIPIWISFPRLRPHFFSPRILFGLGGLFGKPLKIDEATAVGSRPSIARVLVELDITKSYPKQVWLGSESLGYTQEVIFDEFPQFCAGCKCIGHSLGNCPPSAPIIQNSSLPPLANLEVGNVDKVVTHIAVECENVNAGFLPENSHEAVPHYSTPVREGVYVSLKDVNGEFVNGEVYSIVDDCLTINAELDPSALPLMVETPTTKEDNVSVTLLQGALNEPLVAMVANGELGVGGMNFDSVTVALSPNAIPFFPHAVASVSNEIMQTISTDNLNFSEGGAPTSSVALAPIVLEAEPPSSDVRDVGNPISSKLIEVQVNLIDTQAMANCLGESSGLDIRNHLNWLNVSSYGDSKNELSEGGLASPDLCGVSDPGNDFSLVRARTTFNVGHRGRFWGRGRCRR
ncbi:Thioredoxin-like 4, chloroplastic [Dendrobium catenatum]|uniref:Thioredoxin-like 4, chloroplastic n=1 Tax=Dendrobium catenatum TaxID=906689 RepID=A0A2I0X0H3_9ASPA|nr:Thioredoxin-like 4, chloroplastic [Dendrobium catenatum]